MSDVPDDALARLNAALSRSLESADILCAPAAERLARDHYHRGYLAYLDWHVTAILNRRPNIAVADAQISTELHQADPWLERLLRGQEWIGFIGPHPDLAQRLGVQLGIPAHTTTLIPGEMRLPDREGLKRGDEHFPDRYEEILAGLILPRPGSVVLVAAGLLGKVYCARVKELGGIAIDIGSVADAWLGFKSRPGQYEPPEKWLLP